MKRNFVLLSCLLIACSARDCDGVDDTVAYNSPGPVVVKAEFKMKTADFDLETASGLLKTKQVSNADELQSRINDPQSGINNVDLDGDGMIDFVAVKEERDGNNRQLNFVAFPSSKNGQDPIAIASVSFQVQGSQLTIVSNYAPYVNGVGAPFMSTMPYGPSFGDMLFMNWLFAPRPIYVYPAYSTFGYRPRTVIAPTVVTSQRTMFRQQTSVAPIQRQVAPSGVTGPKFATQSESRFKPTVSQGNALSSSGRQAQDFQARSPSQSKPTASSSWFGSGSGSASKSPSPSPSSASGSSFSKPSSSFGSSGSSFSKPSSSSSSSFGSSRSSFGSSGSSFGSSRSSFGSSGSSFGRR